MLGLAHLDRPFDYLVDAADDETAVVGARAHSFRAGRLVDGFVLERRADSDHVGSLSYLDRAVSGEPVLTPELATLARAVADRYAGTMSDVVRLAVLPVTPAPRRDLPTTFRRRRMRRTWRRGRRTSMPTRSSAHCDRSPRRPRTPSGRPHREQWPQRLAELATAVAAAGRGTIIIVPDQRDLDRLASACEPLLGDRCVSPRPGWGVDAVSSLARDPESGAASVVAGTRSAVFAPVHNLGLVVVWDDGDDSLAEPRAPYPHPREVAVLRTHQQRCGFLVGGFSRTAEAQALVESGWAHDLVADRQTVRARMPRVLALSDSDARDA